MSTLFRAFALPQDGGAHQYSNGLVRCVEILLKNNVVSVVDCMGFLMRHGEREEYKPCDVLATNPDAWRLILLTFDCAAEFVVGACDQRQTEMLICETTKREIERLAEQWQALETALESARAMDASNKRQRMEEDDDVEDAGDSRRNGLGENDSRSIEELEKEREICEDERAEKEEAIEKLQGSIGQLTASIPLSTDQCQRVYALFLRRALDALGRLCSFSREQMPEMSVEEWLPTLCADPAFVAMRSLVLEVLRRYAAWEKTWRRVYALPELTMASTNTLADTLRDVEQEHVLPPALVEQLRRFA